MKQKPHHKFFFRGTRIAFGWVAAQGLLTVSAIAEIKVDIPASFTPDRYVQMVSKSPFALATPVTPTVATPPFAANLYVTGIAKIGDADFVSISSRDQQATKFSLFSGETGQNDISLVGIEWSEQIGKSKVTLKKGSEFAVLEFDQIALQQQAPTQPIPVMPHPSQPNEGRRVILPNQPQNTPPPAPSSGTRQRIRIINSKP